MLKKNIYKWHRTCSIIIAIPVLLWACSGFMHPIMTNLRPAISTQSIPVDTINKQAVKLSLQEVLKKNQLDTIYNARLVHIDTNWFYQVHISKQYRIMYISAKTGSVLSNGDWLYAQYLARIFLEGAPKKVSAQQPPVDMPANMPMPGMDNMSDCCGEAANTILHNKTGAPVESASLITRFDAEYKPIYCLLPVYKVQFKRNDHIRIYVKTTQDRFSIAVDKNRAAFTTFFDLVHTWGWLNFIGKGRLVVVMLVAALGFVTAMMGLYILFTTSSKRSKTNKLAKSRRVHRITSTIAVLFTLMFTFSGCYQAFSEFTSADKQVKTIQQGFATSALHLNLDSLRNVAKKPLANFGLAEVNGQMYWQVYTQPTDTHHPRDLMKDMSAPPVAVTYVNANNYSILNNGDEIYARELAARFSNHSAKDIVAVKLITHFTDEYNFTDKRLPVWKVDYPFNHNERYYVETLTGTLAKRTNNAELVEGYSFALFHKHHYMDFAGKTARDISTMVGAALQILMVIIGLVLYFRWRNNKVRKRHADNAVHTHT